MENRISQAVSVEEQHTTDRYYGFEQKGTRSFQVHLKNMPAGTYLKRIFSISREHGSSYDVWMSQGAPDFRGSQQINYLSNISTFHVHYEPLHITEEDEWIASTVLDEHEVQLILIEKNRNHDFDVFLSRFVLYSCKTNRVLIYKRFNLIFLFMSTDRRNLLIFI